MRPILLALALSLSSVIATPALAAEIATLGCMEQGITPAFRAKLTADFEGQVTEARYEVAPALRTQMEAISSACASKHGWSAVAAEAARIHSYATIALPVIEQALRGRGVNAARIRELWNQLPEAVRIADLDEETLDELSQTLIDEKIVSTVENATIAGRFLGTLSNIDIARRDFIDS